MLQRLLCFIGMHDDEEKIHHYTIKNSKYGTIPYTSVTMVCKKCGSIHVQSFQNDFTNKAFLSFKNDK